MKRRRAKSNYRCRTMERLALKGDILRRVARTLAWAPRSANHDAKSFRVEFMSLQKSPIRLAIVGVGKIVRDQHLPASPKDTDYRLVAAASPQRDGRGRRATSRPSRTCSIESEIDAVSLCMPPQVRHQAARAALEAGKHVFSRSHPARPSARSRI